MDKYELFKVYVNRFLSKSLFKQGNFDDHVSKQSNIYFTATPTLSGSERIHPNVFKHEVGKKLLSNVKRGRLKNLKQKKVTSLGFLSITAVFDIYIKYGLMDFLLYSVRPSYDKLVRDFILNSVRNSVDNNAVKNIIEDEKEFIKINSYIERLKPKVDTESFNELTIKIISANEDIDFGGLRSRVCFMSVSELVKFYMGQGLSFSETEDKILETYTKFINNNPLSNIFISVEDDYLEITNGMFLLSNIKSVIDVDVVENNGDIYHLFYMA